MKNGYEKALPITKTIDKDLELTDNTLNWGKKLNTPYTETPHKLNYLRMIKLHCDLLMEILMEERDKI